MATIETTRREFLIGTGALVVSFGLAPGALAQTPGATKPLALDQVDSFLAVGKDGAVTMYTGKVDIGTGIRIALPQMVAEELDVTLARVKLIEGDTALTPDQGPTWGSLSVQIAGVQLRQAAATARQALIQMAAQRFGSPSADLAVKDGVIFVRAEPSRRVSYAELIGDQAFNLKLDPAAPLKRPNEHTVVGQSVPRPDVVTKVTGAHTYMHDFRVPGMLHARVIRPPAIGATLSSVDESSVKNVKGARVVRQGSFLAVVAESEWAAVKAAKQLKATWSSWDGLPEMSKLWEHVRHEGREGRRRREPGRPEGGDRQRHEDAQGHLRLRHPYPRIDGPGLRRGRRERRPRRDLVALAGAALAAPRGRGHPADGFQGRPHPVPRRRRLLWPERSRGRDVRRRAHRQADRQARARAVDA